ncbi:glycosyltransferase [Microbacterium sp.]|uniref:glycosyltransferase n=1 Tax=Microbacterium sp. TaxID=51671 RepID=UPI002CFC2AAA|nr:glycosyltransferase [Microbacterium sp.]HWL79084.1 glycosyltransferase [Microbacterium sp.]
MTEPIASVIIPAWNAADTIDAQLAAITAQKSDVAWEALVCDNGSTDSTPDRVRNWSMRDSRVRLVDASARRGPSAARNLGALEAHGRVILFCDADDVVADGWIAALLRALDGHDIAAGELEGRSLNTGSRYSVSWEVSGDIRLPFWPRFPAGGSGNLGVRTNVFRALGGFDELLRTGEDVDFCWRAQLAGYRFVRARDALVHCRQRDGLLAVYRQAVAYGEGNRALRAKYSAIAAADPDAATVADQQRSALPDPPVEPTPARSLLSRIARLATPQGMADLAWRIGEARGRHREPGQSIEPLDPRLLAGRDVARGSLNMRQ